MSKNKLLALMLAIVIIATFSVTSIPVQALESENYVEISLDNVESDRATGYYSRSFVTLNIATGGTSNLSTVSAPSVPSGATITRVELTGRKSSGSGSISWYIKHESLNRTASKIFSSSVAFTEFNGLTPDTSWTVWIQGSNWSTVTGARIKVYYTY
ncbi:hypothetical protein EII17_12625 [Clostridiales bacterium COT073_COT-073]|nr:hypothetical protein EII17_12625 [Clostridiales bacterium COT073_COT-073]